MALETPLPETAKSLNLKRKGPRAGGTYRGARRNRARAESKSIRLEAPLHPLGRSWRRLWAYLTPDAPPTTRVLRGKPKFARNALGEETLVGVYPNFPRPSKSKRYSYAGKR